MKTLSILILSLFVFTGIAFAGECEDLHSTRIMRGFCKVILVWERALDAVTPTFGDYTDFPDSPEDEAVDLKDLVGVSSN